MKQKLLVFFAFLFIIAGCSSSPKIDYEEMLNKIVMNAPDKYVELYEADLTKDTYTDDLLAYFKAEFKEYMTDITIAKMVETSSINYYYNNSITTDKQIKIKDCKVEGKDIHYSFVVTYEEDGTEKLSKGSFQIDDNGKINYFRFHRM